MKRQIMVAGGDRLSDLPESILLHHILSMLPDGKQVARSSVLSTRWRFLWKSVPVSLHFTLPFDQSEMVILDCVNSVNRELHYWRSCEKIQKFDLFFDIRDERFVKDVDLWIYFATKLAIVEDLVLERSYLNVPRYEIPQFAYKNSSLRNLVLSNCAMNPSHSVKWNNLVSLSISDVKLTESVMEKILYGCPNLECLELDNFWGIYRLEISNVKLKTLLINRYGTYEDDVCLDIFAPYVQKLKLSESCREIRLRNVTSLVTAILDLHTDFDRDEERNLENECSYLKELLHSVAHVHNLELGAWCIECLSILELEGWQPPPSSWKFLQLNLTFEQLDLSRICRFLESSSNLETLIINGFKHDIRQNLLSKYTNEDKRNRRFETHNFSCSLLHLKAIKFIDFPGPSVKNLLKHATVLEKFVIAAKCKGFVTSEDCVKMKREFPRFLRSSPNASFIFSY